MKLHLVFMLLVISVTIFGQTQVVFAQVTEECKTNINVIRLRNDISKALDELRGDFDVLDEKSCGAIIADAEKYRLAKDNGSSNRAYEEFKGCLCGTKMGALSVWETLIHPWDTLTSLYEFVKNFDENIVIIRNEIRTHLRDLPSLSPAQYKAVTCKTITAMGLGGLTVVSAVRMAIKTVNAVKKGMAVNSTSNTAATTSNAGTASPVLSEPSSENGKIKTFSPEKKRELARNAQLSDSERIAAARQYLNRDLTAEEERALLKAHYEKDLAAKVKILHQANFTQEERRILIQSGLTGTMEDMAKILGSVVNTGVAAHYYAEGEYGKAQVYTGLANGDTTQIIGGAAYHKAQGERSGGGHLVDSDDSFGVPGRTMDYPGSTHVSRGRSSSFVPVRPEVPTTDQFKAMSPDAQKKKLKELVESSHFIYDARGHIEAPPMQFVKILLDLPYAPSVEKEATKLIIEKVQEANFYGQWQQAIAEANHLYSSKLAPSKRQAFQELVLEQLKRSSEKVSRESELYKGHIRNYLDRPPQRIVKGEHRYSEDLKNLDHEIAWRTDHYRLELGMSSDDLWEVARKSNSQIKASLEETKKIRENFLNTKIEVVESQSTWKNMWGVFQEKKTMSIRELIKLEK